MEFPTRIDGPVAVIGDVHGQVDQLEALLGQLRDMPDIERRWIVFIGDLVDRGPDPKGAIDIYLDLCREHKRTAAIAGNHELAMAAGLGYVPTPDYTDWPARWIDHYGSHSTFASYGAEFGNLEALRGEVPQSHQHFLANLPWLIEHPEFLFVHAGLDPDADLATQLAILRERDFTLNRPTWLCSKSLINGRLPEGCYQTVVSGHVPVPEVQFFPKRMLIDTTGGVGGHLSCVLLPEAYVVTSAGDGIRQPVVRQNQPAKKGWFGARR